MSSLWHIPTFYYYDGRYIFCEKCCGYLGAFNRFVCVLSWYYSEPRLVRYPHHTSHITHHTSRITRAVVEIKIAWAWAWAWALQHWNIITFRQHAEAQVRDKCKLEEHERWRHVKVETYASSKHTHVHISFWSASLPGDWHSAVTTLSPQMKLDKEGSMNVSGWWSLQVSHIC